MPILSLLVPTLGDAQRLPAFLRALTQTISPPAWEILLVFNTVAPPPAQLIDDFPQLPLRLLHQPLRGKSRALNLALSAARGDWLVFTDDDVIPDSAWLTALAAGASRYPQANVLGGRILSCGAVPAWIRRSSNLQTLLLSEHDLGESSQCYAHGVYPIGPNMAVKRAQQQRMVALWAENLGPGTELPVGDERNFLEQLSPPLDPHRYYLAEAVVHHPADPRYLTLSAALRRCFLGGFVDGKTRKPQTIYEATAPVQRAKTRLRQCRSWQEFLCLLVRAAGFFYGKHCKN